MDFHSLLSRRSQSRSAVFLLNGILALFIVLSIVHWIRVLMAIGALPPFSTASSSSGVGINANELTSYHLFGNTVSSDKTSPENIPLSSLNLKLTGVIASNRGGFALISVNGQAQSQYFLGEEVTQNTVLDEVLPDRVILLRGNSRESLLLDENTQNPDKQVGFSRSFSTSR